MTTDLVKQRLEMVTLAGQGTLTVAELCRRLNLSRKAAYKWLRRYREGGVEALADRSRRPQHSPRRTAEPVEQAVLDLRARHPAWGPRKLQRRLQDQGKAEGLPARSTFGVILRRAGAIAPQESVKHRACQRFERAAPNELWQMDFKGDFVLGRGGRCHPLPLLDDHSRFLVGIFACGNQREQTVRGHLATAFERYGLPEEILCDNGGPWAGNGGQWTGLGVWLLRLGIRVRHGRPYHPQTQGKEERFNRTLKAEVLSGQALLRDLAQAQQRFEEWRSIYNCERPHEALGLEVPAQRYVPSARRYQARLPEIEYGPDDVVRRVKGRGEITWSNRTYSVGTAFAGQPVALRRTAQEHLLELYYCAQRLGRIDLRLKARSKNHYLRIQGLPT